MRATAAVALGFCAAMGCTKKPSAEECAKASSGFRGGVSLSWPD